MKIEIYTTPTCHYCNDVKALVDKLGYVYIAYDVAKDPQRKQELMKLSGRLAVPVTVIDGDVFVGFDKEKLESRLRAGQ